LLKCHYSIYVKKPLPYVLLRRPYPQNPITIGDYLYKKRLDLNLTQKQVAQNILKTSVDNIRNWETNRSQISLLFYPRVIDFINFCPYDASLPLGLKLKERRNNLGLSIKKLSQILDINPCTIAYWERNEHKPSQRYIKILEDFLKSYSPTKPVAKRKSLIEEENFHMIALIPKYIEYDPKWNIGRKIIVWRVSNRLSQRKLAKVAGISFQSICRWEKEQRVPKPKYLKLILQAIISYAEHLFFTNK